MLDSSVEPLTARKRRAKERHISIRSLTVRVYVIPRLGWEQYGRIFPSIGQCHRNRRQQRPTGTLTMPSTVPKPSHRLLTAALLPSHFLDVTNQAACHQEDCRGSVYTRCLHTSNIAAPLSTSPWSIAVSRPDGTTSDRADSVANAGRSAAKCRQNHQETPAEQRQRGRCPRKPR